MDGKAVVRLDPFTDARRGCAEVALQASSVRPFDRRKDRWRAWGRMGVLDGITSRGSRTNRREISPRRRRSASPRVSFTLVLTGAEGHADATQRGW